MPFVKLDCGILDSTLWVNRNEREVFLTALLMSAPREFTEPVAQLTANEHDQIVPTGFVVPAGWYGFVESSGPGIVRRALVDDADGLKALERLGAPDPQSRSRLFDGRRMIRVDGGYLILNYMAYRERDYGNAERCRRYRQRKNQSTTVSNDTPTRMSSVATSMSDMHADADADAYKNLEGRAPDGATPPAPDVPRETSKAKRGTRIDAGLELAPEWRAYAEKHSLDADATFELFKAHYLAKSGQDGTKIDWFAAWRKWCLIEVKDHKRSRSGSRCSDAAITAWLALITNGSDVARTQRDARVQFALDAIGGFQAIRMRTAFDTAHLQRQFCEAFDHAPEALRKTA